MSARSSPICGWACTVSSIFVTKIGPLLPSRPLITLYSMTFTGLLSTIPFSEPQLDTNRVERTINTSGVVLERIVFKIICHR